MPLVTQPNEIALDDFSAGWCPDLEPSAVPPTGLLDVKNLLPDLVTGQPQTRPGYSALPGFAQTGRVIRSIHPYPRANGDIFLILIATTTTDTIIYQYNLKTLTSTQVSPAGMDLGTAGRHFGFVVDDVYYGGAENVAMYSWNGTTFTQNAGAPSAPTAFVTDKAYRKGDRVEYTYNPGTGNITTRFASAVTWVEDEKWSNDGGSGQAYKPGDKISHNSTGYWRTYICRKKHNNRTLKADNSSNPDRGAVSEPGAGTDWREYWRLLKMKPPVNEEFKPTSHWFEVPDAPVTSIATWHANRMFARNDNVRSDRLIFSSQSEFHDVKVGATWDPKDWRVTGGADGAGWQDFKNSDGDYITGLYSFGYYLLVFMKDSVHVIAGVNPETWNVRLLDHVGAVGRNAVTSHDGIVYFLGDRGFFMTDGTTVEPVPGEEKIRDWMKSALDREIQRRDVLLWSDRGMVWISLPSRNSEKNDVVLSYDPATQSFWPQTLKVQAIAQQHVNGMDQIFFAEPTETGAASTLTSAWSSAQYLSTSVRSDGLINYLIDPSFEYKEANSWTDPDMYFPGAGFGSGIWTHWSKSHNKVKRVRSVESVRRGTVGVEISNERKVDEGPDHYEGIFQTVNRTGNHVFSVYVRRPLWQKTKAKPRIILRVGATRYLDLIQWEDGGDGWWRAWITVNMPGTTQIGLYVMPGATVQADQVMLHPGTTPVPYFDGDGMDATDGVVTGGGTATLFHFAKLDTATGMPVVTDNGKPIPWTLRTGWQSFGAHKEMRRVRKTWALVRGQTKTVLRIFRNYMDMPAVSAEKDPGPDPATFFEGRMIPDSYAVGFSIEGAESPPGGAAVLSFACWTEPRFIGRYHF